MGENPKHPDDATTANSPTGDRECRPLQSTLELRWANLDKLALSLQPEFVGMDNKG